MSYHLSCITSLKKYEAFFTKTVIDSQMVDRYILILEIFGGDIGGIIQDLFIPLIIPVIAYEVAMNLRWIFECSDHRYCNRGPTTLRKINEVSLKHIKLASIRFAEIILRTWYDDDYETRSLKVDPTHIFIIGQESFEYDSITQDMELRYKDGLLSEILVTSRD